MFSCSLSLDFNVYESYVFNLYKVLQEQRMLLLASPRRSAVGMLTVIF